MVFDRLRTCTVETWRGYARTKLIADVFFEGLLIEYAVSQLIITVFSMPQIFKLPQIVKCRIFFRCRRTRNAKFETRNPKRETRNADDAADFLDAADLYFASAYFFKMPHIFVNAADFFKCRRFSFCFGRFSFGLFFSETDLRLVPQMTSKRLQRIDLVRHRRGSSAVLCLRGHCMVKCRRPDGHDLPIF